MWYIADIPITEKNRALVVVSLIGTSLAFAVTALRLFTRGAVVKKLGMDDYLMTGAMASSIGYLVACMFQIKWGLGQHLDPVNLVRFMAALYATVPCYNLAQTCYKLSVTVQSYRLFTTPRTQWRLKVMFCWILVCGIMSVLTSLFYCKPLQKAWNLSLDGSCADLSSLHYSISAINILNDVLLLAIPAPFIIRLQVPKKQRILLISIFACGAFVTIVSIIRLKALYDELTGPPEEFSVRGVDIAIWSQLEINAAIIFLSVPAVQAFVSRVILGKHYDSSTQSAAPGGFSGTRSGGRRTFGSRNDEIDRDGRIVIAVQQSVEMKSYPVDDTGSEKDLITKQSFTPAIQSHATIIGGGGGGSPDRSPATSR